MKKKLTLLLSAYIIFCFMIYQKNVHISKSKVIKTENIERVENTARQISNEIDVKNNNNDNILATLTIDKINLHENIYDINDKRNNVEEHVTILNNSELNNESLIILAAHSGNGKLAYFNRLNELKENDKVRLSINNKELVYKVKKIEEQDKTGKIEIIKSSEEQLILTTCSKNDSSKQLVIYNQKI